MKQQEIIENVKGAFNKIHKLSEEIKDGFEEEAIHEFRKEIKKLRAFLRLLSIEESEEDQKLRITSKMKTFYGYVGIIRNLQLQQKNIAASLNGHKPPQAYFSILKKEKEDWQKTAREYMDVEKDFYSDEEKIVADLPNKHTKPAIVKYINQEIAELMSLLTTDLSDVNIHSVRKILKDLQYNWLFIKRYILLLPFQIEDEKELKALTDLIGRFHDKCVSLSLVHSYNTYSVVEEEKELLQQIERAWIDDKKELKEIVLERLDSLKYTAHKSN
jgi:CHAD domain-containing protein